MTSAGGRSSVAPISRPTAVTCVLHLARRCVSWHPEATMQVWLDVFGVRGIHRARAFAFMATHRRAIRRIPMVRFAKLMGTGSGETFTMRDADPEHWAILTVIPDDRARQRVTDSRPFQQWRGACYESAHIQMLPIASHGSWSGMRPFDTDEPAATPVKPQPHQPVASITRARLKPRMLTRFWRAVPPVVADLTDDPAVVFTLGIGEAPVGLQGTFSIWKSGRQMSEFAYRRPAHRQAIEQTRELDWYTEELFARLAVESVDGTYCGKTLSDLVWSES